MLKPSKIVYIASIFLVLFVSCTKDELTKPADMRLVFKMNIEGTEEEEDVELNVEFNEGTVVVRSIEFEGEREAGDDIAFTTVFEQPVIAYLNAAATSKPLKFEIPQGIYTDIDLNLRIGANGEGLIFKGIYTDVHQKEIPVIFEYDFEDELDLRGVSKKNTPEIVLSKSKETIGEIFFDQKEMFKIINSTRMLQSAKLIDVNGTATIIISKDHNQAIFNNVVNRIERFTQALFE